MKKHVRCIVMGCQNHKDEGEFVGEMCLPCHKFVTRGEDVSCTSQAYRNALQFVWQRATKYVGAKLRTLLFDFVREPHLLAQHSDEWLRALLKNMMSTATPEHEVQHDRAAGERGAVDVRELVRGARGRAKSAKMTPKYRAMNEDKRRR